MKTDWSRLNLAVVLNENYEAVLKAHGGGLVILSTPWISSWEITIVGSICGWEKVKRGLIIITMDDANC